jgi:periplasmic protein TonB
VKVRAFAKDQNYVEIEFTNRQPGYWGVYFPSDGTDAPKRASAPAAPAPPIASDVKVEKAEEKPRAETPKPLSPVIQPPAPRAQAKVSQPASTFAQLGSKEEDIQPAAAPTSARLTSPVPAAESRGYGFKSSATSLADESVSVAPPPPPVAAPAAPPVVRQTNAYAAPGAPLADVSAMGDSLQAQTVDSVGTSNDEAPFGRYAASASLGGGSAAREPFGSSFGGGTYSSSEYETESSGRKGFNWLAIAAGIVGLFAVGTGAAYFLHMPPFDTAQTTTSATLAPSEPSVDLTPQASPATGSDNGVVTQLPDVSPVPAPPLASVASSKVSAPHFVDTAPTKPSKASQVAPTPAIAPAAPKSATKVADIAGSLSAHPTTRAHTTKNPQSISAPALDASASLSSENVGLPAISATPAVAPPPQAAPEGPVRIRVGGALRPPRLVSSVVPNYPTIARQAGVEGDVVIDTTIDTNGAVTGMKVVSGPPMLRQAALDALRQWRYEPSKLNGEPVPVQMVVTLKFHRN